MILQAILVSQLVKWNFINLNKAYLDLADRIIIE
jgi:hypothetical protein